MVKIDLQASGIKSKDTKSQGFEPKKRNLKLILAALAFTLVLVVINPSAVISAAYNNLGSIKLSKALLSDTGLQNVDTRSLNSRPEVQGLIHQAQSYFNHALVCNPNNAQAYKGLGCAYLAQGNYPAATEALLKSIQLDPSNVLAYFALGNAYEEMGKTQEAIGEWRRAGAAPYFLNQAKLYEEQNKLEKAKDYYELTVTIEPNYKKGYYALAHFYLDCESDKRDKAISALYSAVRLEPSRSVRKYLTLGRIHRLEKDWDAAIAAYRMALQLDPGNHSAHYNLGVSYWGKGEQTQAIEELQQAIRTDPQHIWSYIMIGIIFMKQGQHERAVHWYAKAEAVDPNSEHPHIYLGRNSFSQELFPQAITHFTLAIDRNPDNAEAHYWLGLAYRKQGLVREASKELNEAIDLEPRNKWYHLALGDLYRDNQQAELAIAQYKMALELDPDDHYAEQEMQKLLK